MDDMYVNNYYLFKKWKVSKHILQKFQILTVFFYWWRVYSHAPHLSHIFIYLQGLK